MTLGRRRSSGGLHLTARTKSTWGTPARRTASSCGCFEGQLVRCGPANLQCPAPARLESLGYGPLALASVFVLGLLLGDVFAAAVLRLDALGRWL